MLAPWKKSYDHPRQHIKKQRYYFAKKCPSSQRYGVSSSHVWMWELDCKEAERWRIDAFELWCWRRLLRVPWSARRSNQSMLKEIVLNIHWKDSCWSWILNILATWCEELTLWKRCWCWERLKAGEEGDDRRWDGWMASSTWWELVMEREAWRAAVHGISKSWTGLSDWTELITWLKKNNLL